MKFATYVLCGLSLLASAAMADTYPKRTLIAGSVICSKAGDWSDMVEASTDQDEGAAGQLLTSGKCRIISTAIKVSLIEPEEDGVGALILLPSGKTANTSEKFLR
ncbi:hypothetical protein [Pseudomonas sp. GM60]|uniref:hypothetical protein n=1 Tax=Pseudomonas sp. GM60 TaxID=1144334 RepID=UPI0002705DBC|nr:hypothetical protein [Pseudomonas sp. GM60]EJM83044.1 hypothetical protein PMI32_02292 [Pseudomonas sp. GM60]